MRATIVSAVVVVLLAMSACTSHYSLVSISRTRILIDSTYDALPDSDAIAFITPYKAEVDSIMGPVVGTAARYMYASKPEGTLSNLLPDILLWGAHDYGEQPDFAVYNMGGIRAPLAAGTVTYGDILEVEPYDNKLCFLSLTGDHVMELFTQIAGNHGEGLSHGVNLVISPTGTLLDARLYGEEIHADSLYRIVTIDYVAEGNDNMTAFREKTNVVVLEDESNYMRDIIVRYFLDRLSRGEAVDADLEGRITVKTND